MEKGGVGLCDANQEVLGEMEEPNLMSAYHLWMQNKGALTMDMEN